MSDDRPTSPFSRTFASVLRGYMNERGITRPALMKHMHRSKGYVAEHLNGKRPPDTDMVDAVAEMAGVDSLDLLTLIRARMSDNLPPRPGARPAEDRAAAAERIAAKAVAGAVEAVAAGMPERSKARGKKQA
jgi:hypothetical protein